MTDLSRRAFPCPKGRHAGRLAWKTVYLTFSFEENGKEIWWCEECKEHFVREGNEFYPLLGR